MILKTDYTAISVDDALNNPELAHLHDLIRYLEEAPDSEILPHKYESGIEYMAGKKVKTLFTNFPDMPIRNVVSIVLQQLPDDISASLIIKLTPFIINEWERCRFSNKENTVETV